MTDPLDHLERERFSPLGATPLIVLDARDDATRYHEARALIVGVDREGVTPAADADAFDVLLTTAEHAPRPWVSVAASALDSKLETFANAGRATPFAAGMLRQVLRLTEKMPLAAALEVESLAYSTLLGGDEFRRWRTAHVSEPIQNAGAVTYARDGNHVTLTLAAPETRNAMTASMRDALWEALAAVLDDPSAPRVTLRADGACFSVGGALDEFGANTDVAQAHVIRASRSIARAIAELGPRCETIFHGACIGSGLEGPAAAARRLAREGAFFQLPELKFGLIPGAGGTVTLPRVIGRHRACAMMLGGARLSAATALNWDLVQAIAPHS